jgi:RNA polymerase sigma-70 factor (ECF subfamily)
MSDFRESSRLDAISTRWSLLAQAREGSLTTAGQARGAMVLRYAPAIRRYLGAIVANRDDAEDLMQDVLVRLMAGDFCGADPSRGRFRDLLKVSLRNMVRNFWTKNKRRHSVALCPEELPDAGGRPAADPWLAAWRQRVLALAWNALRQKERSRSGSPLYTVLRLRAEHPEETSEELAQRLSAKLSRRVAPPALRQQLRRARLQFADLLLQEVAQGLTAPTPESIQEELLELGLLEYLRDLLPPEWVRP